MERPAIDHGLLGSTGHMSKRAQAAALRREAARLFPPGFWDKPPKSAEDAALGKAKALRRQAAELLALARRGMCPRKYRREAARLARRADAEEN